MDVKKLGQLDQVQQSGLQPKSNSIGGGPSFDELLKQTQNPAVGNVNSTKLSNIVDGVKFSNHAVERMMSRGIKFSPESMQKLNEAVSRAANKGSKDSLILMDEAALIVSVKNKTVVTVMDKAALKENVFTNIDSTIVM